MFAERYLYVPPNAWLEGRQALLWPVYTWKVLYPAADQRFGANLFQESILGLMRAGVSDPQELARLLAIDAELVRFIIANQLQPNGWLNTQFKITSAGEGVLDEAEESRVTLRVGYAFQDAIGGQWLPRFVSELPEIAAVERNEHNRPVFRLDRNRGRTDTPFLLPNSAPPNPDYASLIESYRAYRKDVSAARREEQSPISDVHLQAIENLSDEPTPMYLWCELYRDDGETQPWLVSDPFRLRRAASWLRKPLLKIAPGNQGLLRKMQQLVPDLSPESVSADEWLRQVEERVDLTLRADYPYLGAHELIREHLASVLRQLDKTEHNSRVLREELATLLGEAHNLIEAVLKWMLERWSVDARSWAVRRWSREEAKDVFEALNLPFLTSEVIDRLAGQQLGEIQKAIRFQNRPLKALLAGALFCSAERLDHPFRSFEASALALERLPALADNRNKTSGHAAGVRANLPEVLSDVKFAIRWMGLFQDWYSK